MQLLQGESYEPLGEHSADDLAVPMLTTSRHSFTLLTGELESI